MNTFGAKRVKPIIVIPNGNEANGNDDNGFHAQVYAPPPPVHELVQAQIPAQRRKDERRRREDERKRIDDERQRARDVQRRGLAQPVQPVQPVQIEPVNNVTYDNMTPNDRAEMFWKLIDDLKWHNQSDGAINLRQTQNTIGKWSRTQSRVFGEKYNECYDELNMILDVDGMFVRNGIDTIYDQAKTISHAIALGKDQYGTLRDDLAIYQFLVDAGECQSLDAMLPNDMRH